MEENIQETQDSIQPEQGDKGEQIDEQKPEYTEREKQLYNRVKKLEEKLNSTKEKLPESPDLSAFDKRLSEVEMRAELRHEGYSIDEIRSMESYAKGAGKSLADVKDDPFVKAAIDKLRADKKADDDTPPPSGGTTLSGGKPVNEALSKGSWQERDAALQELLSKRKQVRR